MSGAERPQSAVERFGPTLACAEFALQNHFPALEHVACDYRLRRGEWIWTVALHSFEGSIAKGSDCDLAFALAAAMQTWTDAGFYRPIAPPPPIPPAA